jgi:dephospho-CoA kinase
MNSDVLKSDYVIINIDSKEIAKKKTEQILKILKIKQKDS